MNSTSERPANEDKNILNKNINATFNDFTDLQFILRSQSIEMNSLGLNLWISHESE